MWMNTFCTFIWLFGRLKNKQTDKKRSSLFGSSIKRGNALMCLRIYSAAGFETASEIHILGLHEPELFQKQPNVCKL